MDILAALIAIGFVIGLVGLLAYGAWRILCALWREFLVELEKHRQAKAKAPPAPESTPVSTSVEAQPVANAPPEMDTEAIAATRARSLAAMNRATEARKKDKADRREHDDAPLAGWSPGGAASGHVGDIEFDYIDARGQESRRHVLVSAVDREYLEGICLTAGGFRTFRIRGIQGDVQDNETGELLRPNRWAEQARRDPRNGAVTMGSDDGDDEPLPGASSVSGSGGMEILFTGFAAARRAELEAMAEENGWTVRQSVTVGLDYLCTGPKAGPTKIRQAEENGALAITEDVFLAMVGE